MAGHPTCNEVQAQVGAYTDLSAAVKEQQLLAGKVRILPDSQPVPNPRTVLGLDISYAVDSDRIVAAAVLVDYASGDVLEHATLEGTVTFPYVPGLLAFREVPLLLQVIGKLQRKPDLLLCDGQGFAHPARCGLACHLGVLLSLPSIGSAKSHYIGDHNEPGRARGDRSSLKVGEEIVGYALRTQTDVKPVFVSPGHNISQAKACEIVLHLSSRYRVPDPIRFADQVSRRALCQQPTD